MACSNLPCNLCNRLLKSTSVEITGVAPNQVLTVTIPSIELENLENYCLVICQRLPVGSDELHVVVDDGGTILPLECKKGNFIKGYQIISRKRYSGTYGNDPLHLMINNCVPIE